MSSIKANSTKSITKKGLAMANNQTADLELTAEELREFNHYVGLKQALERLEQNPDFQKVILEDYFKNKPINGVSLLATDYVKKNGLRGEIMEDLVAVSKLQDYFLNIKRLGTTLDDVEDDELVDEE
jgi:hypothetical protein